MMSAIFEMLGRQGPVYLTTLGVFALASLLYGLVALGKFQRGGRVIASSVFAVGFLMVTYLVIHRWILAQRPPFNTLYESLVLFVWCTAFLQLAVERFYKVAWFGCLTGGLLIMVMGYAALRADADIVNLPAALQSGWFMPHVVVYFFGYAALFFAFAAAILYLIRPDQVVTLQRAKGGAVEMSYAGFMHKAIVFGFVLLTIGLVIGSVWAKQAWGDYWMWDPKEDWALVSWLVFAIYLHLYRSKTFSESKGAWMTIAGFLAIGFTYLGMNLLPTAVQSVHVYQ